MRKEGASLGEEPQGKSETRRVFSLPVQEVKSPEMIRLIGKETLVSDNKLPLEITPSSLRKAIKDIAPPRTKSLDTVGKHIDKIGRYVEGNMIGTSFGETLAEELTTLGEQLQGKAGEQGKKKPLTAKETARFDDYCGVIDLIKLKNPGKEKDRAVQAETREAVFTQFAKVVAKAQEGSAPHQKAVTSVLERYIQPLAEHPTQELIHAVVQQGMEEVKYNFGRGAWTQKGKDLLENFNFPLQDDNHSVYEALNVPGLTKTLEITRKQGNKQIIGALEQQFVTGIQKIIASFPYEDGMVTPKDMLDQKKENCVGATTLLGSMLQEMNIPYAVATVPEHEFTFMVTSDGSLSWRDPLAPQHNFILTDTDITGNLPDGNPMTVRDVVTWIKNPTPEGLVVHTDLEGQRKRIPEVLQNDERGYVLLSAPEHGHSEGILTKIAFTLEEEGMLEQALVISEQARKMTPHNPYGYENTARLLLRLERIDDALKILNQGIALNVDQGRLYGKRAALHIQMNNDTAAEADLLRATTIRSGDISIWRLLGMLEQSVTKWEESARSYEQVIRLTPEGESQDADFYYNYGFILDKLDRTEDSLEQATKATQLAPDNPDYRYYSGVIQYKLDNLEEAEADVRQATILAPDNPTYRAGLGEVQYKRGKYEEAEETLTKAIALDENEAEPYYHLALTREKLGSSETVRELLQKANELVDSEQERELTDKIQEGLAQCKS